MNGNKIGKLFYLSSKIKTAFFIFCLKLFILTSCLFTCNNLRSQIFSGTVYDQNNKVIIGALVTLVSDIDGEITSFVTTDENGKFTLKNITASKYTLTISALGFFELETELDSSNKNSEVYVLTKQNEFTIKEVVLTTSLAIKIKKDTVELNAKSFLNGSETNVEDLLKNLPGVSVDSDGKVRVGGQEVEKIMIENDDFFEKGYTLLTKNMPVTSIDKIQILQRYSNNKHLKKVEHSEKVAINLTLDENTKKAWFGNASISSSFFPDFFYSGKVNLIKMGRKSKYFLLGSANNNGATTLGDLSHLIKPSNYEEPGFINIEESAYKFGSNSSVYLPFGTEQAKFNKDQLASFNTIQNLNHKVKLKLMGFVNRDKIITSKSTLNRIDYNNISFSNFETQQNSSNKKNYFGKINLDYDISESSLLQYSGSINLLDIVNLQDRNFNGQPWEKKQNTAPHSINQNVLHTYKINERTVWLNALRFFDEEVNDLSHSSKFFFENYMNTHNFGNNFSQSSNSEFRFFGALSQLLYRTKNDNLLDISLFNNYKLQSFANIMFAEIDGQPVLLNEEYQNTIQNKQNELGAVLKYTWSFKKVKLIPEIQYSITDNFFSANDELKKTYFLFSPRLSLAWTPHYKGKLSTSIFWGREPIGITEMLPNYFSVDPRYLSRGVGNFVYLKNSGGTLRYSYGDWSDRLFVNVSGSYKNYNQYLSNILILKQDYTVAKSIIYKDRKDYILSGELDYFLKKIKSNLKLTFGKSVSYYQTTGENNLPNDISASVQNIGLNLKSGWKRNFNYTIGVILNDAKLKQETKQQIKSQQAFVEINLRIGDKFDIMASHNHYSFGKYFSDLGSNHFLNSKINYQLSKSTSLSLIGNNLLNQNNYQESIIAETATNSTQYKLLPRYVMLELKFSL